MRTPGDQAQFDPQATHAVDMDFYFDTEHFVQHTAGGCLGAVGGWVVGAGVGVERQDAKQSVQECVSHLATI